MSQILMKMNFKAPQVEVFERLTDHEELGRLLDTQIKCIVEAPDTTRQPYNRNGLGSVRRIKSFGVPSFEETVVTYEPPHLMEYTITKGSPVKNHLGRMQFSEIPEGTHLHYTIDFVPRLNLGIWRTILQQAIKRPVVKGLQALAAEYERRSR